MPRRLGISNYHLIWRKHFQFCEEDVATKAFLAQFRDDPSAMASLRGLAADSPGNNPDAKLTDDAVLAQLANLLLSGELIALQDGPAPGGAATQPEAKPASQDSASSPVRSSKQQPPENPTLPPTNGSAQAASLAAAAASGKPFCAH